jgi:hypothetical protein
MMHTTLVAGLGTDAVVTAGAIIIGALLTLITTLIGLVLHGQRGNRATNKATLHQVKNSHETNLRDDLDEKQDETRGLIRQVRDDLGEMRVEIREVRQSASDDRTEGKKQWRDIGRQVIQLRDDLENTQPVIRKRKPPQH